MTLKKIFTVGLLVLLLTVFVTDGLKAQSDYSKVNVSTLSDAQVKQVMQRGDEMGYTDAQLIQAMKTQGLSDEQGAELIARMQKIRTDSGKSTAPAETSTTRSVTEPVTETVPDAPKSRIFGADLFNNGSITFEPNMNMATPKGYIIGPGDELLLDLTGDNEASYKLRVSPEGFISMEYVGRVSVGGLTIDQATSKIRSAMGRTYPALRSGRSQIALNLGNIRSIKVIINGEVNKPGTYTLPSLATVFNALYASGGPNERGSFRQIQVIRNNLVVSTIDIYDFLVKGFQTGNIRLQDQDVIHVPVFTTRVDVVGEVKRPAIFEVLPHETFSEVLKFAGGFSDAAYSARIKVVQTTPTERKILSVPAAEFDSYYPKNGDLITVEPILDRYENKVEISGAVFRPGVFELTQGLTLSQLIKQAEGLREDAFRSRGYIIRLNPDNTTSVVPFDLAEVLRNPSADIKMQREDLVQISSIFDLREEYNVSIGGEVRNPGTFGYADNMTVKDLVQMAGGFKEGATNKRVEVSRRIRGTDLTQKSAPTAEVFTINIDSTLGLAGNEFLLKPFDIVSVRSEEGFTLQQQIRIEGEVLYPGIYTVNYKNERISDIIKRAGGLTAFAFPEGASLKRPGADASKSKNLVNDKEEDELNRLNLRRLAQAGAKDSSRIIVEQIEKSDLVGIDLERILKSPQSRQDLIVEDGDIIRIPRLLQTVKVSGEVLKPNSVVYVPGKTFDYYITAAGGFTERALKRRAFVTYANGSVKGTKMSLFARNHPPVKPGSEIAVPQRAEREKMSTQAWVGIGTAVATLAALVISIIK
ncbi:MAG: capsule biosynthesis protein [Sphingobacteriales bacterium 41-5]|nr:MAG: capsule biosynthesis protein [Sphingobacteriales bacterium 41-5]